MPKRKTAEVNLQPATPAEVKKRTPAAAKPAPVAAATHKRPAARKATTAEEPVANAQTVAQAPARPTYDEIAKVAYFYAEARGFRNGSPEEDWLRAERELLAVS